MAFRNLFRQPEPAAPVLDTELFHGDLDRLIDIIEADTKVDVIAVGDDSMETAVNGLRAHYGEHNIWVSKARRPEGLDWTVEVTVGKKNNKNQNRYPNNNSRNH